MDEIWSKGKRFSKSKLSCRFMFFEELTAEKYISKFSLLQTCTAFKLKFIPLLV